MVDLRTKKILIVKGDECFAKQLISFAMCLSIFRESDPQFNKKKRHIGNNYVAIVYNEAGQPYEMGIVKVSGKYMVSLKKRQPFNW